MDLNDPILHRKRLTGKTLGIRLTQQLLPKGTVIDACQEQSTKSEPLDTDKGPVRRNSAELPPPSGLIADSAIDWYERRHELKENDIFRTFDGSVVKLDRRVPGDGTKWYVLDWFNGHWSHEDGTIEPGDLEGEPLLPGAF